jgi:hypothetical protein
MACDRRGVSGMTASFFAFLPNLYAVIEELQWPVAWFGVLIAMDL